MPSLFNLIHLLLSFASRLNIFSSKPSFRSFIFYFIGILLKPRFSHILSISKIILYPYQRLQYLISDSSWYHQSLSSSRISLIKDIIKSKTSTKVILIIDDTSWRRWNKFSSKQYCSNIGKVERCQVVVRADIVVFVEGVPIRFPISVKPYFTKDKANELRDDIGEFKSKIELAKECVEEAMKFFDIDYVVFDSWYTTKDFIRFIEEKGLKWVGQFKSNRIVKIEGRRTPLSGSVTVWGLNKNQKSSPSRSLSCFQAQIEGIGEVKIVLVDEGGGRISYIVSRESVGEEEMVKLKRLRWQTEKLNEELKNMLGMDEYRVRKKEGIMRHCEIVMCAYTFLQYIRIEMGLISRTPYQILEMIWERIRLVKIPDIILPLLETTKSLKF
jgi:SRSO17 transposase